jgi:glycosyltransferase involved in cell wall biosynthesis
MKFKNYKLYIVGFKKNFKRDDIITLGYVDDNKLDKLYKKAKVFFFPTLYEGFGYPVIEAMSRGTAVVTSKLSSLPEICKDNALYVNPYDIMDMSLKLKYILSNDELRKKYENNGLKLSKKFDINLMLKKYVNLIKEF